MNRKKQAYALLYTEINFSKAEIAITIGCVTTGLIDDRKYCHCRKNGDFLGSFSLINISEFVTISK